MHKGSVYQSKEWIAAKIASGDNPIRLGGLVAFERKKKVPFIGRKTILFAEGSFNAGDDEEYLSGLIEFKSKSKKYFYGLIAPTVIEDNSQVFEAAGMKKVSNNTVLIDLSLDKEALWKNLEKKSIRWGVNTAENNNLKFESASNQKDIALFYKLYIQIANKGGFSPESEEFILALSNTRVSKLFLIKRNGEIVAGGLMLIDKDNGYSILNLTASSEEGLKLQAMPYLYWNIILYSKSLGLKYLDLGGYDAEAREKDKTYNINKFKERFGGKIVEQPIYSTNWRYPLMRKFLKNIRFLHNIYFKK